MFTIYIYYPIYIPNLHISDCLLYTWESLLDMDVITNGYIPYDNYLLLLLVVYLGMSENGAYPSNSQFQWEKNDEPSTLVPIFRQTHVPMVFIFKGTKKKRYLCN